jgi:hypothetical protein
VYGLGRFLNAGDVTVTRLRTPELGCLLLAGAWCFVFFSFSGSKLETYILPAFPPLALALGAYLCMSGWKDSPWPRAAVMCSYLLLAVAHTIAVPMFAQIRSPLGRGNEVRQCCSDPAVPVACFPRPADSVAFYLEREDFRTYRSKETPLLLQHLQERPATVVFFTQYHALETLRKVLPPTLRLTRTREVGVWAMAVVERQE